MKTILDPCCGSRMFWFDKKDDRAVFTDKRSEQHILCDGRELIIEPDTVHKAWHAIKEASGFIMGQNKDADWNENACIARIKV